MIKKVYNYVYSCIDKNVCDDCSMAKFGVNVVVLVDNMLLVFFYFFSKTFKKKFLLSLYYEKKKFGRSFQLKRKILAGEIFLPPSQDI